VLRRYAFSISVVLALSVCALVGSAQVAPMPQFGIVPNGSYESYHVDAVNMDNGNDIIKIPLFSLPQLGKLSLSFSAVSNTTYWTPEYVCDSDGYTCEYYYIALSPTYGLYTPAYGGDEYGGVLGQLGPSIVPDNMPMVEWAPYVSPPSCAYEDNGNQVSSCYSTFWTVYDSTGGSHSLYYDSTNISQLRTTDGSGFLFLSGVTDPSKVGVEEVGSSTGPPVLIDSHGVKNVGAIGSIESGGASVQSDPDGNTITNTQFFSASGSFIGTGYTDTMNRPIPPIPPATSSTVGCPNLNQAYQPVVSSAAWQVPGPNNTTATYLICYASITYRTDFFNNNGQPYSVSWYGPPSGCPGCEYYNWETWYYDTSGTSEAIQSIVLPDQTYWGFVYDAANPADDMSFAYGTLSTLLLPEGGSISYSYFPTTTPCSVGQYPTLTVSGRTVSDGNGNSYPWQYFIGNAYLGNVARDPNGNDTVYQYKSPPWSGGNGQMSNCDDLEVSRKMYAGPYTDGNLLRTVATTYTLTPQPLPAGSVSPQGYGNALPQTVTTILDTGASATTTKGYGGSFSAIMPSCGLYFDYGTSMWECTQVAESGQGGPVSLTLTIPVSTSTTDYSSSTILSSSTTTYQWQSNSSYLSANLLDTPNSVVTTNGSSQVAQTTTTYDESSYSPGGIRGHHTTTTAWLNTNPASSPTSHTGWNANGEKSYTIDPDGHLNSNGHTIDYVYGQCSGIEVSDTYNALNQHVSGTYDCNTGHVTSFTDANARTSQFGYDIMGRMISASYPDGGQMTECFTDLGGPTCALSGPPYAVVSTRTAAPSPTETVKALFDGLGRVVHQYMPDGSVVDTVYDGLDQVTSKSNPYYSTSEPTYGITSYAYDGLGRTLYQCEQDNGTGSGPCVPGSSYLQWSYSGNVTTSYDELRHSWQRTSDALERLTQVVEPIGSRTTYNYDALGNLLGVTQAGIAGTDSPISRSFSYDSLSRLLTATNPETGTVCYGQENVGGCTGGYDPNGNLLYKTDARGVMIQYSYDGLNRLTGKTYSDGVTPSVALSYDSSTVLGALNTIGRLTGETVVSGTNTLSQRSPYVYDAMGRVKQLLDCVPANCSSSPFHLSYNYDLAGHIVESTNGIPNAAFNGDPVALSSSFGGSATIFNGVNVPSILLTSAYDASGRLSSITSSWADSTTHPDTLLRAPSNISSAPEYGPVGMLNAVLGYNSAESVTLANLARTYDNRLHLVSETDTGTSTVTIPGTGSSGQITISGSEASTTGTGTPASTQLTITGGEGSHIICIKFNICNTIYDTGHIAVTVAGFQATASYGEYTNDSLLAAMLATALNASGTPVQATSNANVVTMTSIATGAAADYPFTISNGADFDANDTSSSLTGGNNGGTTYDSGTILVNFNGSTFSIPWNSASTASNIASQLFASIESAESGSFTVTQSGPTISLASLGIGTVTNLSISCSAADGVGQSPSFAAGCSGMAGGVNAYTGPPNYYSFTIPPSGGYAPNGNLLNAVDSIVGNWSYQYDNLNRLTQATASLGTYMGTNVAGATLGWSYDSFGNRLVQSSNVGVFPTGSLQFADSNNQATGLGLAAVPGVSQDTLQYDQAGDLTGKDEATLYAYDAEGRVCAVSNGSGGYTGYVYNAEGNRIAKGALIALSCNLASNGFSPTNTSSYVIGIGGEQLTEIDTQGTLPWAGGHSNVFANGAILATYRGSDTYFAFNDWLGTKRVEVTPDSLITAYSSLPFGDGLASSGNAPDATEQHFTGKERDTESGLDYFGARYYGSNMGRFMSPDPSGLLAQRPEDPQSWNMYAYARNNPLIFIDPNGLDCIYATDNGKGVESIDHNSSSGECGGSGGTWLSGYVDEDWAHYNKTAKAFEAASEDGSQVNFAQFQAGAQTNDSGGCLSGCGSYGFASTSADFLTGQLVGNSRPTDGSDPLDGLLTFMTKRDQAVTDFWKGVAGPINGKDNWAGPGGMGPPQGTGDWRAAVHDYNFNTNGITIGSYFNPHLSPATSRALIQSNNNLMRTGGVQGAKEKLTFGVINAFQWYADSWK